MFSFFCSAGSQWHTFVPAGDARPPTPWEIGSPSRFLSPMVGFCSSSRFLWRGDFLKKLRPCFGQSSILRVRRGSQCHCSCSSLFFYLFRVRGGGGHPVVKIERTKGAAARLHSACRDRQPVATQRGNHCQMSGVKARSCEENAICLRAQNIKAENIAVSILFE